MYRNSFFKKTVNEWRIVFWITFAVLALTTLVYLIWASGEVQSWNDNLNEDNWLSKRFTRKRTIVQNENSKEENLLSTPTNGKIDESNKFEENSEPSV